MQGQPQSNSETSSFCKHMWSYSYQINGRKGTRTQMTGGYVPLALKQTAKQQGVSSFSIKTKVTKSEVRMGLVSQSVISKDAWTRDKFIYFDNNLSKLNKNCCASYKNARVGEELPFVNFSEVILRMEVNMATRKVAWFRDEKLLVQVDIPKDITAPLHPFFSLRIPGDSCEFI